MSDAHPNPKGTNDARTPSTPVSLAVILWRRFTLWRYRRLVRHARRAIERAERIVMRTR